MEREKIRVVSIDPMKIFYREKQAGGHFSCLFAVFHSVMSIDMLIKPISIIDAPSILGLQPSGVEKLPEALKAQGFVELLNAQEVGSIVSSFYDSKRDEKTNILNPQGIRNFSSQLANKIHQEQSDGNFPVVLGGDCSIIIGCLLALRRVGRFGLFFIDGHADFYQPEASPTGEVADMDLAIVTGRGPELLTNIENLKPLVRDEDVVAFGYRDREEQERFGSQDIQKTKIHSVELSAIKKLGITASVSESLGNILNNDIEGFWIHLDADVLNDAIMSAVDYRLFGGLSFEELSEILSILLASGKTSGMSISIFNPTLDDDGSIAKAFVRSIVKGFKESELAAKD